MFDGEAVADVDASGVAAIEQLVVQLAARGITVVGARLKSPVAQRFDATG